MRWLVVVALVVAAQAPGAQADDHRESRDRAVEQLPVIATIDGGRTPVVIRGALRRSHRRRAIRMARRVYADFNKRFARPMARGERPRAPVDLCLFPRARDYWRFVGEVYGPGDHAGYGFYMPRDRLVVINWAWSQNNLRHEILHPLINDDFPGVPAWLNEGLSALHTSVRYRRGLPRFRDNFRLRHVRRAIRRDALPTWRQLARSTRRHLYGRRQQTYYSTARYVLFYLSRIGRLPEFYKAMRGATTRARQQELLERFVDRDDFVRWLRRRRR